MRNPRLDGRIVGGEEVTEGEIRFQVSLQTFGAHVCGGFILDEVNVITAGHCCDIVSTFTVCITFILHHFFIQKCNELSFFYYPFLFLCASVIRV